MESSFISYIVNENEFQDQNIIHSGLFSKTFLTLKIDSVTLYSKKNILFPPEIPFKDEYVECFINICEKYKKLNHQCSLNLSFISFPNKKKGSYPSIYTVFHPNSLQNIIDDKKDIDKTQKIIILYGISQYLSYLHKTSAHGNLKASNVLLDSNLYPLVSDPFFYELYKKIQNLDHIKTIDYIVSLSKETLSDGTVNSKTDIYSFGILTLQILSNQINVYSDISQNVNEIKQNILKGVKPTIPNNIQGEIRSLIENCLSHDPEKRPDASYLVKTFQDELKNINEYDTKRTESFQQYLYLYNNVENEEKVEKEKVEIKEVEKEEQNVNETGEKEEEKENEKEEKEQKEDEPEKEKKEDVDEKIEKEQKEDEDEKVEKEQKEDEDEKIEKEQKKDEDEKIEKEQKKDEDEKVEKEDENEEKEEDENDEHQKEDKHLLDAESKELFEKQIISFLNNNNYVFTNEGVERLTTLYCYLEEGNMISLVGPNGTSRTLSSEIVCELSGRQLINFCLTSKTTKNYFTQSNYPFITAFEKGHTLLLENFNQANQECLQFIQKSLTNKYVIVPGIDKKIPQHKNFRLIIQQSQNYTTKLTNMFKVINFPAYAKKDLIEITQGLVYKYKCNCSINMIEDLVEFNIKWSEIERTTGYDNSISIEKIATILRAISENENIYETIMIIYGSKHIEKVQKELQNLFTSYPSFKFFSLDQHCYPKTIPKNFQESLYLFALQSILYYFKNNCHVIIASEGNYNLKEFVQWVAQYYKEVKHTNLAKFSKTTDATNSSKKLINNISKNLIQTTEKVQIVSLSDILNQQFYNQINKSENQKNSEIKENIHFLCTCNITEIKWMTHCLNSKYAIIYINEFISTCSSIVKLIKNSYNSKNKKENLVCIDSSILAKNDKLTYADNLLHKLLELNAENCEIYFFDSSIYHSDSISTDFLNMAHEKPNSELIADICEQSSIREHLFIFTGGSASVKSIDESDRKMKLNGIKFNQITTYVFGNDLSVSAPYSRHYPSITYIGPDKVISLTKEDTDALDGLSNINTYNDFNCKYSNLRNAIQAKTLGTEGDKDLRDILSSISPRIRSSCNNIQQKNEFDNMMKSLQNMTLGALRFNFTLEKIESALQEFGDEVAVNKAEAFNFFKITANKNDINSMINYANMIIKGIEDSKDKSEAVCFYKKAIDNENTTAMVKYGDILFHGNGVSINKPEAAQYYKKAADNKNTTGMIRYAKMLYLGNGIPINKLEAARYFKMAAENGYRIDFFGEPFLCFKDIANTHGSSGNLWCIDCSGSVSGCELYHNQLKLILSKYRKENDDFYLWDHKIHHSSSLGVDIFTSLKEGRGGTDSALIADICELSSIRDHLIIVTDGCVNTGSIDESDRKMQKNNIKFNHVTTYIIGSGGDLSVGAPYSRRSPNVTYMVQELGVEIPQISLTKEDISALEKITNIETYNQFTGQYSHLHSAIKAKTLGTEGDDELQEQIMSFTPKVKKTCANKSQKNDFNEKMRPLQNMAIGALRNTFTPEAIENIVQKPPEEAVANTAKAAQFFKKMADKGDVDSMVTYANIKLKSGNNADKLEAAEVFKKAADEGDETAMFKYADMLRTGDGIQANKEESARYFKKAADIGNVIASLAYAFMLKHGDGVSANQNDSAKYFKLAADNGGAKEKLFYAYMLKNGDGIPRNKEEADKYFKLAASAK